MRKPGKGNVFMKGMKSDMDPSLQPNDSYRFGKNIRLISQEGGDVGIQPYDSDRLALKLGGVVGTSIGITDSVANVKTWVIDNIGGLLQQDYTIQDFLNWAQSNNIYSFYAGQNGEYFGQGNPNNVYQIPSGGGADWYVDTGWQDPPAFDLFDSEASFPQVNSLNSYYDAFAGQQLGLSNVFQGFAPEIQGGTALTFTITLTTTGGTVYTTQAFTDSVQGEILEYNMNSYLGSAIFDSLISNAINEDPEIPIQTTVNEIEGDNNINWTFLNNENAEDFVETYQISVEGFILVGIDTNNTQANAAYIQNAWWNEMAPYWIDMGGGYIQDYLSAGDTEFWDGTNPLYTGPLIPNNDTEIGPFDNFIPQFFDSPLDIYNYGLAFNGIMQEAAENLAQAYNLFVQSEIDVSTTFVEVQPTVIVQGQAEFQSNETSPLTGLVQGNIVQGEMQILGHYEFSDYLVLIGKWNEMADQLGYPVDFVIKVHQDNDGLLSNQGNGPYDLFYLGNLGLTNKEKLKVTGAEENEHIRRVYFTDGTFPLRTINVGANPLTYTNITNNPDFFNLFVKAKFSVPRITGFDDGGNLETISYSYCYRYKTGDGRFSKISPISNPASFPFSSKTTEASLTKGGNVGIDANKRLYGIIENLDTRYDSVELIYIPYIDNAPGTAVVFNSYAIPAASEDETSTIEFTHTGNEITQTEILVEEMAVDTVTWDTCQALEVKDNRLFCGNLSGNKLELSADFSVTSYNSRNETHSPTANPDLYNDMLYSQAGLEFPVTEPENANIISPENNENGRYCKPNNQDLFRYIRGPGNNDPAFPETIAEDGYTPVENAGLWDVNITSPEYWSSSAQPNEIYQVKRGIFGAESRNFNTALTDTDSGNPEFEGLRVTFKVLGAEQTPDAPIQLDNSNDLITTGSYAGANVPFYKHDINSEAGDYYSNYANPVYNSNYVGYRRGEVYRFGIVFYDKSGSPMFVQKVGDIRIPEHSAEYFSPTYFPAGQSGSTSMSGAKSAWPYYYQTSRSEVDAGFSDWAPLTNDSYKIPYSGEGPGEGQYGCVVYPYFEVRLSSRTVQQIGGYSIIRVPRDADNRTIVTSGVLSRAVKYMGGSDDVVDTTGWTGANINSLENKFGNEPMSLWTPTQQNYRAFRYGVPRANDGEYYYRKQDFDDYIGEGTDSSWHYSNVYTMDSPDAMVSSNFTLNLTNTNRLKIVEQRYTYKENVANHSEPFDENNIPPGNSISTSSFINAYFSDFLRKNFGDTLGPQNMPPGFADYTYKPQSLNLFASLIEKELINGFIDTFVDENGETQTVEYDAWKHKFSSNFDGSTNYEDEVKRTYQSIFNQPLWNSGGDNLPESSLEAIETNVGIYTKYYSKRIGAYPMYGMARPDWTYNDYSEGLPEEGPENGLGMRIVYHDNESNYSCQFAAASGWDATQDSFWDNRNLDEGVYRFGVRACNILPDIIGSGTNGGSSNFGETLDAHPSYGEVTTNNYWNENKISFAKVVNPGEVVKSYVLKSDRDYKNATMWHDFHNGSGQQAMGTMTTSSISGSGANLKGLGGNPHPGTVNGTLENNQKTYAEKRADFAFGNKTIVLSLENHGSMPITRHCLQKNNYRERVDELFGFVNTEEFTGGDAGDPTSNEIEQSSWSQYSPEVTVASITTGMTTDMYGGNDITAFSKNTYISTGHYTSVNQESGVFYADGNNGNHVFGGDTYICNLSLKKTHMPKGAEIVYNDKRAVLLAYTCPIETEANIDLRHGESFSKNENFIPKQFGDDTGGSTYNESYNADPYGSFLPAPLDFIEVDEWPSTVAWSEAKFPGDYVDAYAIFPINQIKDLDYSKGPITQMFLLQNSLFALQNSGTCLLSVNPRVMIPSEGGAISTVTGTDSVVERFDYVSETLGSQNFHGLAISDRGAYFYDDNSSKFLKLMKGQGGGWGVSSLGEATQNQSFFHQYKNSNIGDRPLTNLNIDIPSQIGYDNALEGIAMTYGSNGGDTVTTGGIALGFDPEHSEALLTIFPSQESPFTIVYNEKLEAMTGFVSKRGAYYINYKNRMYTIYDNPQLAGLGEMYLSNGYQLFTPQEMTDLLNIEADRKVITKYLNFGQEDYYIFASEPIFEEGEMVNNQDLIPTLMPSVTPEVGNMGPNNFILDTNFNKVYKEPIQLQVVLNDEPFQSKLFDKIQIMMNGETDTGKAYLYFRKFAYYGSADRFGIHEFDTSEIQITEGTTALDYSSAILDDGFFDGNASIGNWYSVKENTHNIPMKARNYRNPLFQYDNNPQPTVRGNYAIASMVMGWNLENRHFANFAPDFNLKNENFNIFSLIPYYRYSKR